MQKHYIGKRVCKNPSSFAIENEAGGNFPKQSSSADFLLSENQQSRGDMQFMFFPSFRQLHNRAKQPRPGVNRQCGTDRADEA